MEARRDKHTTAPAKFFRPIGHGPVDLTRPCGVARGKKRGGMRWNSRIPVNNIDGKSVQTWPFTGESVAVCSNNPGLVVLVATAIELSRLEVPHTAAARIRSFLPLLVSIAPGPDWVSAKGGADT